MIDIDKPALDDLFRRAMRCNVCFEDGRLTRSFVDIAQPRWIGPLYSTAKPRVLIVLTNPGSGEHRRDDADKKFKDVLHRYRSEQTDIQPVFRHQFGDMDNWTNLIPFYIKGFGLDMQKIAFANIAWCGTVGKTKKECLKSMLETCFEQHTWPLLSMLEPELLILGGEHADGFHDRLARLLPGARIEKVLHYRHRKGLGEQVKDVTRVRAVLAGLTDRDEQAA